MIESLLQKLQTKLGGRRVTPPLPPGALAQIEGDDSVAAESSDAGLGLGYFIEYRAASGKVTARRIACKRYEPASGTVLAYCFERQAVRRFKVEGIMSIACPETGEVFDRDSLFARLAGEVLPVKDERLGRVLTILVFMMRCDREAHPLEGDVLEDAVTSFALRFDGGEDVVIEGRALARALAPDANDVAAALRWINARPDRRQLARLVLAFIDRVIAADGKVASEEAYFGGLLRDACSAMAA